MEARPLAPGGGDRQSPSALLDWAYTERQISRDTALSLLRDGIADGIIYAWWVRGSGYVDIPGEDLSRLMIDADACLGWLAQPPEISISAAWLKQTVAISRKGFACVLDSHRPLRKSGGGRPLKHEWGTAFARMGARFAVNGAPPTVSDAAKQLTGIFGEIDSYPDGGDVTKHAREFWDEWQREMGRQ